MMAVFEPKGKWTEAEVEIAAAMWREGASPAVIGARIGKSRSSVCGYALRHRDMMPERGRPKAKTRVYEPPKKPRPPRAAPVAAATVPEPVQADAPAERADAYRPVSPVRIVDLPNSGRCRWPLWGFHDRPSGDSLVCGDPVAEGAVYCAHHHARAHPRAAA